MECGNEVSFVLVYAAPQLLMYNLLYGFKVINHFKAKFYLMAEMEKSGLDEMTCHAGSAFLPSGCREAESQTFTPHGVCGWGWPGPLRVGVSSAPCLMYKLGSSL